MDESPLSIRIFQKNETTITVKNNLQPKQQKETSTKTGLSNLRKRYELMGIENGVSVYQNETLFSVTLKLF